MHGVIKCPYLANNGRRSVREKKKKPSTKKKKKKEIRKCSERCSEQGPLPFYQKTLNNLLVKAARSVLSPDLNLHTSKDVVIYIPF